MPLRYLSDPSAYFSRTITLERELQDEAKSLFNRFTDYQVAIVTLGDMSIRDVAPVFERINSTGTPLTIVDLMRAATWSPTFDLVEAIDDARERLAPKKFNGIDRKTFLRTVSAAADLGFSSAAMNDLRGKPDDKTNNEYKVKTAVASALEAAKRAADFLATQIRAPEARSLPYANQFTVLTEIFRLVPHPTEEQYTAIRTWFWRTTLSSYFGGWNTGQMASDRQAVKDFASGQTQEIVNSGVMPQATVWSVREFRSNSATSKMLALMLAHEAPVDLLTAQSIDVGKSLSWGNDKEYHHFFPKAYLSRVGVEPRRSNAVANIVLLTSHSNIQIRDTSPSDYLGKLHADLGEDELCRRLARSLVPQDALLAAFDDQYQSFLDYRSKELHRRAMELVGGHPVSSATAAKSTSSGAVDDSDTDTSE